jgi:glycosyltransferase involved in cell wall biosynthesis
MKRVLWFSNSPVSLDRAKGLGYVGGGWIESLEREISARSDIELAIVIQQERSSIEDLYIDNVRYFICPIRTGRIKRKIGPGRVFKVNDNEAVADYLSIIEKFKPEIIHIFGTENNYGLIIPKTTIPTVIHIQGLLTLISNKFYCGLSPEDVTKYTDVIDYIKGTDVNHAYRNSLIAVEREQKILMACKYIIGRTEWDKRASSFLAPDAQYFHCDEMMRSNFFSYTWQCPPPGPIRILSVLRSNIYKGFDVIIRASSLLKQRNVSFEWNIAGASKQNKDLRLFLKKYKNILPENIKFLGNKNPTELIELMKISQMFIHTSYIENSPNSVCEAMLTGMPVIATFAGGTPSLIQHQKEGILLQEGDPYSLASAILEISANPEKAVLLGENARRRALERHHPETIIHTLLSIYHSVSSGNSQVNSKRELINSEILTK